MTIRDSIYSYIAEWMQNKKIYGCVGKVISVDETKGTCSITPITSDSNRSDVRLQASINITDGIKIIPKIDSYVCMMYLNDITGVVVSWSEVESVKIIFGSREFICDNDGVGIINGTDSLKSSLDSFADALKSAVITTPAGPGVFSPQTIIEIENFKVTLSKLLK